MGIVKVHGIHATTISLDDRFSMLASGTPNRYAMWQKRRPIGAFMNANFNFRNRNFLEQIAEKLDEKSKRNAIKQRLGFGPGGIRRFGSESNLHGLRRVNSFGSLNQDRAIGERIGWRQSNGNLSRSASFDNLSRASWGGRSLRGFRKRGGGQRGFRGRFRAGRQGPGRVTRLPHRVFTRGNGWTQGPQQRFPNRGAGRGGRGFTRGAARGVGGVNNRGAARGRGRGGVVRNQNSKTLVTKEELDKQLDQYMASCKDALDRELDLYMKNAMDLE